VNWSDWRNNQINKLRSAGIEDPATELRIMISRIAEKKRAILLFEKSDRVEDMFSPDELSRIEDTVLRRCNREPLDYILGETFFYRDSFSVGPGVLVPRQDSEILVGAALFALGIDRSFLFRGLGEVPILQAERTGEPVRIMDLCTGSGCIGLSISNVLSGYLVSYRTALTELSEAAEYYARKNIDHAREPELIRLFHCNLFPDTGEIADWWGDASADLIVSNPPYIREDMISDLMPEVSCFEPKEALSGGTDGLHVLRAILNRIGNGLRPGGILLVEHGYDQREAVADLFRAQGFSEISCLSDFGGQDRVTAGRYTPELIKQE